MDGLNDGQTDRDGLIDRWTEMNRWTHGQMDRRTDGQGWTARHTAKFRRTKTYVWMAGRPPGQTDRRSERRSERLT